MPNKVATAIEKFNGDERIVDVLWPALPNDKVLNP
jgi:hypothetical protein